MANSFSDLKYGRKNSLTKLAEQFAKGNQVKYQEDKRFWYPDVDKSGNGYAIIRFLPEPKGEDVPFVRVWEHSFQGPTGSWYIEKSLTTLGQNDPVSEYNSKLWNSGREEDKEIARKQKRKQNFVSNILVIKDPAHPENEGKVFLFRYGKKIYNKLNDVMNPPKEFDDEEPMNPFDPWEGANFKLKIVNVEGYRNYDKSSFDKSAPLGEDDEIEAVWAKAYSLQEFLDPKTYKSYDELKNRLEKVLGLVGNNSSPAPAKKIVEPAVKDEVPFDVDEDELDEKERFFAELNKED
jgi:hypothetical protein